MTLNLLSAKRSPTRKCEERFLNVGARGSSLRSRDSRGGCPYMAMFLQEPCAKSGNG